MYYWKKMNKYRIFILTVFVLFIYGCEKYEYVDDYTRFNKKTGENEKLQDNGTWKFMSEIVKEKEYKRREKEKEKKEYERTHKPLPWLAVQKLQFEPRLENRWNNSTIYDTIADGVIKMLFVNNSNWIITQVKMTYIKADIDDFIHWVEISRELKEKGLSLCHIPPSGSS